MATKEKIYVSKPLPYALDSTAKALMEILSMIELETGKQFAFVGGFTRDYGKRHYNDLDICTRDVHLYRLRLLQLGVLRHGEEDEDGRIPHDYFINPYDFYKKEFPIHFIYTNYECGFAPDSFDYSINEFSLKSDMMVYAPTYSWRDLEKKVIRYNSELNVTTNAIMRGVRFAARLGFELEPQTRKRFMEFLEDKDVQIASNRVIIGIDKAMQDGVADKVLLILQELNFPKARECKDLIELRRIHERLILSGEAYIQRFDPYDDV